MQAEVPAALRWRFEERRGGRCDWVMWGCSQRKDLEGDGQNPQISWVAGGWGEVGLSSRWRQGGLRWKLRGKTSKRREWQN